ncbi:MAG: DUF2156 domain-containing protein [Promethearchaeota archaeon]|jgi:hypothetical protein
MDLDKGKAIELSDKPLFDKYFKNYPPEISEFSFTNLFMWRNSYKFLYVEYNEHLILFSRESLGKYTLNLPKESSSLFLLPPIGPNPVSLMIQIFQDFQGVEFHRVPEEFKEGIIKSEQFPSLNLEIVEDRNNWDYIYEVENLKTLPGNRYRQNRRWLNKFLENYQFDFQLISEEVIEKVKKLQVEWWLKRGGEEDTALEEEQKAIYEALDNFTELNFKGALLCIDDTCAAYTFGEMLSPDTLVIHIEKAHKEFEGAYQAINNLFVKNCCEDVLYVNREQDLGIPGLRRAKESYKPLHMVKKSIIFQKS